MNQRRPSCAELLQNDHMAEWQFAFGWQKEPPLLLIFADIEDDEQIPRILQRPFQLVVGQTEQPLSSRDNLSRILLRRNRRFAHRSPFSCPGIGFSVPWGLSGLSVVWAGRT